jgi:hypothetical protein
MSLLDMINWSLFTFIKTLQTLLMEMAYAAQKHREKTDALLTANDRERLITNIDFIMQECRKLDLSNAERGL